MRGSKHSKIAQNKLTHREAYHMVTKNRRVKMMKEERECTIEEWLIEDGNTYWRLQMPSA